MGRYLNVGNDGFKTSINSMIYVDKTGLIEYTNTVIDTRQKFICVSRPRRFGKTMAGEMLASYYGIGNNSKELFEGFEIGKSADFEKYLNKYNVLFLNIQNFLSESRNKIDFLDYLEKEVTDELKEEYPDILSDDEITLSKALALVYNKTNIGFVFIIDEWDCIFREKKGDIKEQNNYLDFLRNLLKDKSYVKLVYMTGILPIKKYGTHSALNMFDEYSMIDQTGMERFTGFTEEEVSELTEKYNMDFQEMKRWYDGYKLDEYHIYSPKSVVDSLRRKKFASYWNSTETYEALRVYIDMNYDGLKDSIVSMLGGGRCRISTFKFQNDMTTFTSKDDILTLLVHLGYLAYDGNTKEVFIPNEEVRMEYVNAIEVSKWEEVIKSIQASEELLEAVLCGDADRVAKGVDIVHTDTTSILNYNNENALSCVISLAFYTARDYYLLIRELPTGKGFADIVLFPRKHTDKPAMILELKWDKDSDSAIKQIKEKKYVKALEDYTGEVILVGINYDKETKEHSCVIEKVEK